MYTFVLMIYLGTSRELIEDTMIFTDIDHCNYYAKEITKRFSTHALTPEDKVVAYCLPKYKELK
jgi:hypothetical protein|tara:strand:+ start:1090 stop:1281 length:192 start_codon:yes stop_codon:yes gene_type:complete